MITPDTQVDDKTLAALVGVSARRIRQLAEAGTLERIGRGQYALGPSIQSLLAEAAGSGSTFAREKTRKMAADASRAELELAKARSEVAPLEEIQKVWTRTCAEIRQRMRAIPHRATSILIGETDTIRFKKILLAEIDAALVTAVEEIGRTDFESEVSDE